MLMQRRVDCKLLVGSETLEGQAIPLIGVNAMNQEMRNRNDQDSEVGNRVIKNLLGPFLTLRERFRANARGQTMTEYALILAAVAILVFVTYETMGNTINSMVEWQTIDVWLAS
ncbi:MAG TPA: Flp family type IVb pilin [Candidatus Binataceae bacterium]|nr:Flp family type IVb pilin [Candidatus Binataceae bacterium]